MFTVGAVVGKLAEATGQADTDQTRVLRVRLIQAGYPDRQAVIWFFGLRLAGLITGAAISFVAVLMLISESTLVVQGLGALFGGVLGFILPGGSTIPSADSNHPRLAAQCGLRIVETLSGLQSGVDDAMVGGGPWPDLHDHERAAVAAAAALVGNVPTR